MITKLEAQEQMKLEFCQGTETIATLSFRKEKVMLIGDMPVIFYVGVSGRHSFINPLHDLINRLRLKFRKQKPGNVVLNGNLYDQVRIAYCVPRSIAVITVGEEQSMNMFPTDLHGFLTEDYYISSLRIGGEATRQVESKGRIVLSTMNASACRAVYAMGPNHMRKPAPRTSFACSGKSSNFGIALPVDNISYLELQRLSSVDIGIHRIHVYKIVSGQKAKNVDSILAHIHSYYAQWRIDRNIPTDMLTH